MPYDENREPDGSQLTRAMRRQLLRTITRAADQAHLSQDDETIPLYPDAVPDIEEHLQALTRVVRQAEHGARTQRPVSSRICEACPHQFPASYCPLHSRGGCRLYRLASPISAALALELETPLFKDRFIDQSERCHGQDAR